MKDISASFSRQYRSVQVSFHKTSDSDCVGLKIRCKKDHPRNILPRYAIVISSNEFLSMLGSGDEQALGEDSR